jgi:antirestriction protein
MKAASFQYLTDEKGKRKAVVIPIDGHESAVEEFLEDLYGSCMIRRRRKEKTISKEQLLKGLKNNGLL